MARYYKTAENVLRLYESEYIASVIVWNSRTMCWYYMTADEHAVTAEKCAGKLVSEYFETADECADTAEYVLILYEYVKKNRWIYSR